MNQLIVNAIEMTSLDMAEIVGKEHKNVMRDIRNEILSLGEEIGQLIFEPTERLDSHNRKQPIYTFGRNGAMQLALKYDALTRYKVIKHIEELESTHAPRVLNKDEQLKASMRLSLDTAEDVEVLKEDFAELKNKVDNQMTLDYGMQRRLQRVVGARVYELCSDEAVRPKMFRELYREIKDRFAVASYKDVLRKDLQAALWYVEAWIPRRAE